MSAPTRSQVERWAAFGSEGLAEMGQWLTDNPASPYAPAVQTIVTNSQQSLAVLQAIAKRFQRAELLARKAELQAEIDAITAEIGA